MKKIAILGDGGWGTAASLIMVDNGHAPVIWGHDPAYLAEMDRTRVNRKFLPSVILPGGVAFEPDLKRALAGADAAIVAIPTQFLRPTFARALGNTPALGNASTQFPELVVSLVKGLEKGTFERPSEIIRECVGVKSPVVLSGPSHAEEVAKRLPASVVVACPDAQLALAAQELFMNSSFRVYTSGDALGVELGGALKNVIAVAVGLCEGLGLGDNARSALMTRGLAEITRFAVALGAQAQTFMGLSGIGDLITTCVSPFGRNRAVGVALAQGKTLFEIASGTEQVAEGVHTCVSVVRRAEELKIDMPICAALHAILYQNRPPREAVRELMERSPKAEGV